MSELVIGGRTFRSRLFVGTGKFSSNELMARAIAASESEMVTVAMKRIDMNNPQDDMLVHVRRPEIQLLPNTSGVRDAEEAVLAAQLCYCIYRQYKSKHVRHMRADYAVRAGYALGEALQSRGSVEERRAHHVDIRAQHAQRPCHSVVLPARHDYPVSGRNQAVDSYVQRMRGVERENHVLRPRCVKQFCEGRAARIGLFGGQHGWAVPSPARAGHCPHCGHHRLSDSTRLLQGSGGAVEIYHLATSTYRPSGSIL